MDEETLRIILDVWDKASPKLKAAQKPLRDLAEEALRTQRFVDSVLSGRPGRSASGSFVHTTGLGSAAKQLSEARRQAAETAREQARAAKVSDDNDRRRIRLQIGSIKQQQREEAEAAREKARQAKVADDNDRRRIRLQINSAKQARRDEAETAREQARAAKVADDNVRRRIRLQLNSIKQQRRDEAEAARQRKRDADDLNRKMDAAARKVASDRKQAARQVADAEKEVADLLKQQAADAMKMAKAQDAAADAAKRQAAAAKSARSAAISSFTGGISSGTGSILSGVGGLGHNMAQFGSMLLRVSGFALTFGRSLTSGVINVLKDVERWALIAAGSITLIGGVLAKMGTTFNVFKENTLQTLTALTESYDTAKGIFMAAFNLAIPSKFMFEEVLDGARTLEGFGIEYERFGDRFLNAAVSLAQGMEKPIAQVTRFLGNLSQGRLLLQQAAPLAMGRQTLQKYGAEFDSHGSAKDRSKLFMAAITAIEDRWGNIIEWMAGTYESKLDAMVSYTRMFAGKVTEGLFEGLKKTFGNVADFFAKLINPQTDAAKSLVEGLKTPFDLLGSAIEKASEYLPKFAEWLSTILTKENVINVLTDITTAFLMLYNEAKRLVNMATGGKGFQGLWTAFAEFALNAIDFVIEAWHEMSANIKFFLGEGKNLWNMFVEGAQNLVGVLELIVGLMVLSFGAQVLGNIQQIITGLIALGAALAPIAGFLAIAASAGIVGQQIGKGIGDFFKGGGYGAGYGPEPSYTRADIPGMGSIGGGIQKAWSQFSEGQFKKQQHRRLNDAARDYAKEHGATYVPISKTPIDDYVNGKGRMMPMDQRNRTEQQKMQDAVDFYMKNHPNYVPPGQQGSGSGSGGDGGGGNPILDAVRALGRQVIGGSFDFLKSQIPESWEDFDKRRKAYVGNAMGGDSGRQGRRNERAGMSEWVRAGYQSWVGRTIPDPKDPPKMPDLLRDRDESVEEYDAMIKAYEESISGNDRNDKAQLRARLIPLYKKKFQLEDLAVTNARETVLAAVDASKTATSPEVAQEAALAYQKGVIAFWDAQKAAWGTYAEIQEISRQSVDAVYDQLQEANDSVTGFIAAQIELLPESQQAAAMQADMVPQLLEKQKLILGKMTQVREGSKQWYDLLGQSMRVEKDIAEIKNKAADEAAKQAFEAPTRQFSTLKKLIGMMPKRAQKGAMGGLLIPRLQQAFAATNMERDPVKRSEKLMEVADLFSELKEARKKGDPFGDMFDKSAAGERQAAVRNYQKTIFGGRARGKQKIGRQRDIFGAMSPFANQGGGVGGGNMFNQDQFTQLIFQLPANASDQQIADLVMKVLGNKMQATFGRG